MATEDPTERPATRPSGRASWWSAGQLDLLTVAAVVGVAWLLATCVWSTGHALLVFALHLGRQEAIERWGSAHPPVTRRDRGCRPSLPAPFTFPGVVLHGTLFVTLLTGSPTSDLELLTGLALNIGSTLTSVLLRRFARAIKHRVAMGLTLLGLIASSVGAYVGLALLYGSTAGVWMALTLIGPSLIHLLLRREKPPTPGRRLLGLCGHGDEASRVRGTPSARLLTTT